MLLSISTSGRLPQLLPRYVLDKGERENISRHGRSPSFDFYLDGTKFSSPFGECAFATGVGGSQGDEYLLSFSINSTVDRAVTSGWAGCETASGLSSPLSAGTLEDRLCSLS